MRFEVILRSAIPAKERVKKFGPKTEPQRRPRESGNPSNRLFQLEKWIPAFERAKKLVRRQKSGPQRHPRESGDPSKRLFHIEKWIPAFAGMTLRSLPRSDSVDFFTRSFTGTALRRFALLWTFACAMAVAVQPARAYEAYVSNEKGNTVSVIDTDKLEVVKTIKVGQRPRGIAITRDGKSVIVAVGDDDTIQVIDTATKQVTGALPSGPDPEFFAFGPGGKRLYVANESSNTVTVIGMETRRQEGDIQVGVEPEGMTISPDGGTVICTSETSNMAHFIDAKTHQIVANVLVGARPRFAVYKTDGSELWVSSEVGGTVSVIDPVKHEVKKKIGFEVPGLRREAIQAVGINITKDNKLAFISLGPSNRVAVVDAQTYEVRKYLLVGQRVWHGAFTPDQKYLLVTNGLSNDVSVIDVAGLTVIKSIQVGREPWGVAIEAQE
jgi:PQQ-dependent catabolism-associated beta-propeller protein